MDYIFYFIDRTSFIWLNISIVVCCLVKRANPLKSENYGSEHSPFKKSALKFRFIEDFVNVSEINFPEDSEWANYLFN